MAGKNADLSKANAALIESNAAEQAAREEAETNEQTARQQSELAFATLTGVVTDLQKELQDLPCGGAVRRRLLERSLGGFEKLADGLLAEGAADRSRVEALRNLAEVLLRVGGGPEGGETASALAERLAGESLRIAEAMADERPGDVFASRDVAYSAMTLGDAKLTLGETQTARSLYERSVETLETHVGRSDEDSESLVPLKTALSRLGDARLQTGETTAAAEAFDRGWDDRETTADDPDLMPLRARAKFKELLNAGVAEDE